MTGFGFVQYDNEADAKEVVPGTKLPGGPSRLLLLPLTLGYPPPPIAFHGREFKGQPLTVQFARGNRHNPRHDFSNGGDRPYPRPRRTAFRMNITGLHPDTSWQVGK